MTLVAVLAVASWAERKRNANEEYAVYSAYLSEGILNDAHDWSVGGPIQVVVNDRTRAGGTSRLWPLNLLDRGSRAGAGYVFVSRRFRTSPAIRVDELR